MSAADRGWGPGWPNCQRDKIVPLKVEGIDFPGGIHFEIKPIVEDLVHQCMVRGYRFVQGWCWGFACRAIAGTNTASNHSWGLAVDINAPNNPYSYTFQTDMPDWMPTLWKSKMFRWGGDYRGKKDTMHYEFMGTPSDARRLVKNLKIPNGDEDMLKQGAIGNEVAVLQMDLNKLNKLHGPIPGYKDIVVDAKFGPGTAEAVRAVQKWLGYTQSGDFDLPLAYRMNRLLGRT